MLDSYFHCVQKKSKARKEPKALDTPRKRHQKPAGGQKDNEVKTKPKSGGHQKFPSQDDTYQGYVGVDVLVNY